MASTNQTPNYGLPIYSANDRASWVDTNQAFEDIDAALKAASDNASSAASDVSEALTVANEAKTTATGASSLATQANTLAGTADAKATTNASNINILQTSVSQMGTDLNDVEEKAELNRVAISGLSSRASTNESNIAQLQEDMSHISGVTVTEIFNNSDVAATGYTIPDVSQYDFLLIEVNGGGNTDSKFLIAGTTSHMGFYTNDNRVLLTCIISSNTLLTVESKLGATSITIKGIKM